jgi:hypothetical protein
MYNKFMKGVIITLHPTLTRYNFIVYFILFAPYIHIAYLIYFPSWVKMDLYSRQASILNGDIIIQPKLSLQLRSQCLETLLDQVEVQIAYNHIHFF